MPQPAISFVRLRLCCAAILLAAPGLVRADAYWIFFKDKGDFTDASLQQALADTAATYTGNTLERRELRGTAPTLSLADLPVNATYVSGVTASGVTLRQQSAWLNAVSVNASAAQLDALAALPFVDRVQPVASIGVPQITPASPGQAVPSAAATVYGSADAQISQIKLDQAHANGYTGAGVTIGVLDTGFKLSHDAFNHLGHVINVVAQKDFINNTNDVTGTENNQHLHGTYVLGTIAGYKPNTYVGGAYNASFLLAKTEIVPTETQIEEDHWVAGLEWLETNGADVVTSSLGYIDWYTQSQLDGATAVTTIAANIAISHGLPIVNAAGNQGHDANPATGHLLAPADAPLVISVGAVTITGATASFTSDSSSSLGYLKPEVMADGVGVSTLNPNDDFGYVNVNGTSLATPLVASAVALIIEAHPDWTVEQIRNALITTASHYNTPDPNRVYGYGIIDAWAAIQVPEPASLSLLLAGVPLLLRRRRRT